MFLLTIFLNFTSSIKNSYLWVLTTLELSSILVVLKLMCPVYLALSFDFICLITLLILFIADLLLLSLLIVSPLCIKYHNCITTHIILVVLLWFILLLAIYFSLGNFIDIYTTTIPNIKIPAYVYTNIDNMIIKAGREFYEQEAMPAMREYVEKKKLLLTWLEEENADNGYSTYILIGMVVVILSFFMSK